MAFDPIFLKRFELIEDSGGWKGASIKSWEKTPGYKCFCSSFVSSLSALFCSPPNSYDDDFVSKKLDRSDLKKLRDVFNVSTFDLCVAILIWGDMHRRHAKSFLDHRDCWLPVAEDLRKGNIEPEEAYRRFFELSVSGKMPGCGPAYYTKLIFFLPASGSARGVIMDQWTSRSINILTRRSVVRLDQAITVAKKNDEKVYAEFCNLVGELAKLAYGSSSQRNVEKIERRLFSAGGRGKGSWRSLVSSTTQNGRQHEISEGFVIIFEPHPNSSLVGERRLSSRIFREWEEAKATADEFCRQGKVLDIVRIEWDDRKALSPW
ncbi:hypothetical protein [Bradyrhizobium sp. SYSU BS000235]|uniref:8-oxoguanine DNA glycosylase OGG fold protein n=1 Tax=Bradyrhizobium sp. SYSU BS000235 TaxID=3411332 RepID=UPI003C7845A6